MVLASDYPLLGVMWTIALICISIIWILTLFYVVTDVFRSRDLRGNAKAVWLLWVLFMPLVGVIAYVIVRGDHMSAPVVHAMRPSGRADPGHLSRRG